MIKRSRVLILAQDTRLIFCTFICEVVLLTKTQKLKKIIVTFGQLKN